MNHKIHSQFGILKQIRTQSRFNLETEIKIEQQNHTFSIRAYRNCV